MVKVWLLALMILYNGFSSTVDGIHNSTRPDFVNIGALFSFNTSVGRIIKIALDAAVEDVNSDPNILGDTKLRLSLQEDSKYRGFLSIAEVLQLMARDTVAIIGPHSSVTAHVITHIANELQVPLISFSALDPTLSSLQFPFFIRTCHSDLFQMAAIADLVDYYGWKEVIAVYIDDDNGRNGISALGDKLAEKRCRISYKAPVSPEATPEEITNVLVQVALAESRVIVVHANTLWGPKVFTVAKNLGMMGTGYVWIATAFLSAILDISSPLSSDKMDEIQGVLTPRVYTPDSELKRKFVTKWKNLTHGHTANGPLGLSFLSLYAYDTIFALAHALDAFFKQGNRITFSNDSKLSSLKGDNLHLDALNVFDEGNSLRRNIYEVNMTGVTGLFKYAPDKNLVNPAYEIMNVVGTGTRRIGYWSNHSGLSVIPPETLLSKPGNDFRESKKLFPVIWPGDTDQKPRGWVFPNNGRLLRIGVPIGVSYQQFVSQVPGTDTFQGFCIDVFLSAVNLLPYAVPYKFIPYGDHKNNPTNTELVRRITTGGSFSKDYLIHEIGIDESRLVPLVTQEEVARALKNGPQDGGIAAYIDQRAYMDIFLSSRCKFTIVGQEFTRNGWGFAFPRDSPLAVDLSTAILQMVDNGDLQRIHDKWLLSRACLSQGAKLEVERLKLKSFWGLYVICGSACLLALLIYVIQIIRQYIKHQAEEPDSPDQNPSPGSSSLRRFLSFADEKEETVKNRSKRKKMERISYRSSEGGSSSIISNKDYVAQPSSCIADSVSNGGSEKVFIKVV
ncbi:hypothetical protein TSUD_223470 [Trifolium subterraneum]|uniref:Glutamate receptor n=1 Tax=Trifolium subterraneum TaxID=3900 RepID=A0A2Z6M7A4_TRISU|nr:hypothetical protein TSUD_223470 [Trifolium subterraneum]